MRLTLLSPGQCRFRQLFSRLVAVFLGGFLATQLFVAPAIATGVYQMPSLVDDSTWVIDDADVLSRLTKGRLSQMFSKLSEETGNAVRFVTIHRLDYGETAESFANSLFEQWFPTPEQQANAAVLVLDNVTNTAAMRTGDGVKLILPDETAESVTQETLMAPLRQGDRYNQAMNDAGDRLVAILSGQEDPGPPMIETAVQTEGTFASQEETKGSNATIWVIGLLIAATVIPMATYFFYQMQS